MADENKSNQKNVLPLWQDWRIWVTILLIYFTYQQMTFKQPPSPSATDPTQSNQHSNSSFNDNNGDDTPRPGKEPKSKYSLAEQQKIVVDFEAELKAVQNKASADFDKVEAVLLQLNNQQIARKDAYELLQKQLPQINHAANGFYGLEMPDGLPSELANYLKEVINGTGNAYFLRKNGIESMLTYLKDNQTTAYGDAQSDFYQAGVSLNFAKENMFMAKQYVNLNE